MLGVLTVAEGVLIMSYSSYSVWYMMNSRSSRCSSPQRQCVCARQGLVEQPLGGEARGNQASVAVRCKQGAQQQRAGLPEEEEVHRY